MDTSSEHRQTIVDFLKEINPESVLEMGCGYGENLYNIKKAFPKAKVVGFDINKEKITEGMNKIRREEIDIEMFVGDIFTTEFPKKSFDVVLTDAVLLMIDMTEEQIKNVIQKIIKTAKKMIILVEWHDGKTELPGEDVGDRFIRNYVKLFNMFEIKNIELKKITEKEWESRVWQLNGYYIVVRL